MDKSFEAEKLELCKIIDAVKAETMKLELAKEDVREDSRLLRASIELIRRDLSNKSSFRLDIAKRQFTIHQVVSDLSPAHKENHENVLHLEKNVFHLENELTNQVMESADGKRLLVNGFSFHLPKGIREKTLRTESTEPCRGCQNPLPVHLTASGRHHGTLEYLKHSLSCPRSLVIAKKCSDCKLIFLDSLQFALHSLKAHIPEKPEWMGEGTYNISKFTSFAVGSTRSSISCLGCEQVFIVKLTEKKRTPELKYYIHCIDECEEYEKLNLISTCSMCDKKFLNPNALHAHEGKTKHRSKGNEQAQE